jgi:hypothetical protein
MSTSKLILKVQNILKPLNTNNKLCIETSYLDANVINLVKQKVAQNTAISLGY